MKSVFWAALAGSGVTILILLATKGVYLKKSGDALQTELEARGGLMKAAIREQAESIRNQIRTEATDYAKTLAGDLGKEYLLQQFGLSKDNLAKLRRYGDILHI